MQIIVIQIKSDLKGECPSSNETEKIRNCPVFKEKERLVLKDRADDESSRLIYVVMAVPGHDGGPAEPSTITLDCYNRCPKREM